MTSKQMKQVMSIVDMKNKSIAKADAKRIKAVDDLNRVASGMLLGQLDNGEVYSLILKIKKDLDA